jgi:hypothetical protein
MTPNELEPGTPGEAQYGAALQLIVMEGERLNQTFGSFMLAATLLAGFLLTAIADGHKGAAPIGGSIAGIILCGFWVAAYERHARSYDFRMALAREVEPRGWQLIRARGQTFSDGDPVTVEGKPYELGRVGQIKTRISVRSLIGLFAAGYITLLVWVLLQ